jgi:hypothetical protein
MTFLVDTEMAAIHDPLDTRQPFPVKSDGHEVFPIVDKISGRLFEISC